MSTSGDNAVVLVGDGAVTIELTPKQVAEALWSMHAEAQADMLNELYALSDGSHYLMMQFMCTRDKCEERHKIDFNDNSLEAFHAMFSSAYKYMSGGF